MLKWFLYPILLASTAFPLGGCLVAESTYLKKAAEADSLAGEYGDLKQKHEILNAENSSLKGELATRLKQQEELEQVLKAKSDTLSQNISDLRQKVAALETENRELIRVKEDRVREVGAVYEKLLQDMKSEIAQGQVTVSELKGKLTVNLEAALLFDSGRADIKPDGLVVLLKMADTLKNVRDRAIRIEGHAESITNAGALPRSFVANWELSAARAINVARYLQRQGLDPTSLSAAAYGEYRPVADNGARDGRPRHRRIEISLVPKE